ncbi:MAG: MtrB/PioB family outer membrane beta-barrel protein [Desulfobulbaceae bacterium]
MKIPVLAPWVWNGFSLCLLLSSFVPAMVLAANEQPPAVVGTEAVEEEQEEDTNSPVSFGSFILGYRWVSDDSGKAAEYQYPHSSLILGVDTLACPLPHRYHLHAEYLNEKDFYMDAGYAYKDLLLFRDILVGTHHNLNRYDFLYPGEPPTLNYEERNPGDDYFINYASNLASLRLKAPDFPFHTFLKHRRVERDGDVDQRFLLGSFDNLTKTSQTRAIDWLSDTVTLGANSHLGPVEVEYQYDYSEFDPGGGSVLTDSYPPSVIFPRPGDSYPHHIVPETESTANSLKMHTSYAGGLVASATLSNLDQKNNYSGTESGVWKGAFDFRWLPDPVLGLFFRYRHKDLDLDQADMVQLAGTANVLSYPVRRGVSYDKDQFSLSARYKPLGRLTLLSSYDFAIINRNDTDEWLVLPEATDVHTLNLTAQARPFDSLKVKGVYEYKYFDDPAYNTEPDHSNQVRLNTTYTPLPWLTAFLDYVLTETDRDNLRYLNALPRIILEGGEREGRSDRLTASLSGSVSEKVTVTGSWTYSRWDVEQDLVFSQWDSTGSGGLPFIAFGTPYSDQANSYSLSLQYIPREDITLTSEVVHTLSTGDYSPEVSAGGLSLPLASFSTMDATETLFSVEVTKKMFRDWEIGLMFYTDTFDDNSRVLLDGELFVATLTLKRYF